MEHMDVSRLWDLSGRKLEEFYLLVFVWSPTSERWLDRTGRKKLHSLEYCPRCTFWICNNWIAGIMAVWYSRCVLKTKITEKCTYK